jgi:hypothetical protein
MSNAASEDASPVECSQTFTTGCKRAISVELLKLKRTLALRLAIGAPLAVVVLNFVLYSQRRTAGDGLSPLIGFAQINLTMWTIVVLPMYAALAAALVAAVEHQGDLWKHLFALPVSRRSIFAAKWIAAAGLVLVSSLVLAAAICLAAEILRMMKPEWRGASLPAALVMIRAFQTCCAAGLLLSMQLWVSLRWRGFIAGLALAVVALLILLGGVARSGLGTIAVYLYPWALPPTAMARMWEVHADRALVAAWGVIGGAIVAVIGSWHLARRDTY